jgi:hypothetical protein
MANNVGGTTTTHGSTHGAHATNGRAAKWGRDRSSKDDVEASSSHVQQDMQPQLHVEACFSHA